MSLARSCAFLFLAFLFLASSALAKEQATSLAEARAIADTVTSADPDPAYRRLLKDADDGLLKALASGSAPLNQDIINKASQPPSLADAAWLKAKGYDFAVGDNQDAGIRILAPFITLPRPDLVRSQDITTEINRKASPAQQEHALFDADGIAFLFFLAEALGPKLGEAFLHAYETGQIAKAAALIKASEIDTAKAKAYFNYPRPFRIDGNAILLVKDAYVAKDGAPYSATAGAFPSGHTNTGYTDGLLLAEMLPERFAALVDRAAGYGYSRLVLGVHYPLDLIGSRMIVERNLAHYLADPAYHALFVEARDELRAALEKECGESIAACARPAGAKADPWAAADRRKFDDFTMTYGLPRRAAKEVAMQVPQGAEILLAPLRPDLSAAEREELLRRTALPSGYPLDSQDPQSGFWQRIDLYDAALEALAKPPAEHRHAAN